uniref:FAD dependent oxidoreductase domain-containing protein n=1 Tax=Anopheles culicifacies TaxID=139723 RepID=A0A182LYE1_9DIPT
MNICVVGAGVVGLTTALELQREMRNANVTVLADRFEQDTCSDVAAGLFRPGTSFSGPTEEITRHLSSGMSDRCRLVKEMVNVTLLLPACSGGEGVKSEVGNRTKPPNRRAVTIDRISFANVLLHHHLVATYHDVPGRLLAVAK